MPRKSCPWSALRNSTVMLLLLAKPLKRTLFTKIVLANRLDRLYKWTAANEARERKCAPAAATPGCASLAVISIATKIPCSTAQQLFRTLSLFVLPLLLNLPPRLVVTAVVQVDTAIAITTRTCLFVVLAYARVIVEPCCCPHIGGRSHRTIKASADPLLVDFAFVLSDLTRCAVRRALSASSSRFRASSAPHLVMRRVLLARPWHPRRRRQAQLIASIRTCSSRRPGQRLPLWQLHPASSRQAGAERIDRGRASLARLDRIRAIGHDDGANLVASLLAPSAACMRLSAPPPRFLFFFFSRTWWGAAVSFYVCVFAKITVPAVLCTVIYRCPLKITKKFMFFLANTVYIIGSGLQKSISSPCQGRPRTR